MVNNVDKLIIDFLNYILDIDIIYKYYISNLVGDVATRNLMLRAVNLRSLGTRTSYKARYHWMSLHDKTKSFLPKVIPST